jgi:hypothetical protein
LRAGPRGSWRGQFLASAAAQHGHGRFTLPLPREQGPLGPDTDWTGCLPGLTRFTAPMPGRFSQGSPSGDERLIRQLPDLLREHQSELMRGGISIAPRLGSPAGAHTGPRR